MGNPIILVHGIGASASVWQRFEVPGHQVFRIAFSNRFADPGLQVPELKAFIDEVLEQTKADKVILVCHSMGGLVARKYLADHQDSHCVDKLILLSAPNQGSFYLWFNWLPLALIIAGLLGYQFFWPLLLTLAGLIWELISLARGVLLLSPASWAMRPGSRFLRGLNAVPLPRDVKYVAVLSKIFPGRGDGAIALSSQKLSLKSVPNFEELDYSEERIRLPHFAIPKRLDLVKFVS